MTRVIQFTVTGEDTLHCAGCEQRVANALRRLPGIQDVYTSVATQQVVVRIDPDEVTTDQVHARLEQLGYEVTAHEPPVP